MRLERPLGNQGAVCGTSEVHPLRTGGKVSMYIVGSGEGRDWPGRREGHPGNREAAVHRHSLDRLSAINDSLFKKKLKKETDPETTYLYVPM